MRSRKQSLSPDPFGESPDVPTADRDVGPKSEHPGSQLEGRERGPGVDDLSEDRGTVAVGIKSEAGPLGGKVPTTVGAVSDGFLERDGRPAGHDFARSCFHGTQVLTARAREFGGGDLLHRVEVHIEVGTLGPVGSVGNDLAPLVGQFLQRRELLR